ncbi:MAG: alpha/beta hydrolase, partial [Microthrixaceae bacterium]|nr:alpha/beta hydrolase [Microthrixaceae bacterium]
MQTTPETRFAKSGGLSIAYQVVGSGPVDLVFVPGFMSHVELNWEYSFMGSLFESLSEFARLIILDKRGTGLSDRSLGLGTFEERMDDVRAVMDSA